MRARALTHAHTHTGASVYGHDVSHTARVVIGVALGMLFVRCTKSIVESYEDLKLGGISGVEAGKILLIVSVMTLHSFAEGLGIGVSFCGKGGAHLGAFISASLAVCVSLSACLSLWVGARACICLSGRIDHSICESTWYTRRHTHTHTHSHTHQHAHAHTPGAQRARGSCSSPGAGAQGRAQISDLRHGHLVQLAAAHHCGMVFAASCLSSSCLCMCMRLSQ